MPRRFSNTRFSRGGIDGNWSTISLQVGADSKSVDVLIATALSETWVVGTGGCYERTLVDSSYVGIALVLLNYCHCSRRHR